MLTKGLTGWALASLGDAAAQAIQIRSGAKQHGFDWQRLYAFSVHNGLWTAFGLHPILTLAERLGTGVAILSGFPLRFAGLKAALDGCFKLRGPARPATHGALLAAIASVAATSSEDDIGLIIELLGSTLGVAAAYVVPGLCAARSSALEKKHRRSGCVIAVGGMALCVGGTYLTLKTHA